MCIQGQHGKYTVEAGHTDSIFACCHRYNLIPALFDVDLASIRACDTLDAVEECLKKCSWSSG